MATQRSTFAKLQRDRDNQAKAQAKRERRAARQADAGSPPNPPPTPLLDGTGRELSATELLNLVETVHRQFEAGEIDFDTFEEMKAAILSRLPVD